MRSRVFGSVLKEIKYGARNQTHCLKYYFLFKSQRAACLSERRERNQKEKYISKDGFLLLFQKAHLHILRYRQKRVLAISLKGLTFDINSGCTGNSEFTDRQRRSVLPADILASASRCDVMSAF